MSETIHITAQLKALREKADLSMQNMSDALGFANRSGYQGFENPNKFKKKYLPLEMVEKLADLITGRGSPPIRRYEVLLLAGLANIPPAEGLEASKAPTASLIGEVQSDHFVVEGKPKGKPSRFVSIASDERYPPHLARFALTVIGDGANKHFPDGSIVVCIAAKDLGKPIESGKHVIVETRRADLLETSIKRILVKDDGSQWLFSCAIGAEGGEPIKVDDDSIKVTALIIMNLNPFL